MDNFISNNKDYFINNPSISFKCHNDEDNMYYIGIVTNDGIYSYTISEELYRKIPVNEFKRDYNKIISESNIDMVVDLSRLKVTNVNHFIREDESLYLYFGNIKNVVIPNDIEIIYPYAFSNNNIIECITGNNVKRVMYYAFSNMDNLKSISLLGASEVSNLWLLPNLKDIYFSSELSFIRLELNPEQKKNINYHINSYILKYDENILECELFTPEAKEIEFITHLNNDTLLYYSNTFKNGTIESGITCITNFLRKTMHLSEDLRKFVLNNYSFYFMHRFYYAGLFIQDFKIIIYDCNCDNAFYHEIGHALDAYFNYISSCDEFVRLYKLESEYMYSTNNALFNALIEHIKSTPSEYFAECYERYMKKDKGFIEECPLSYQYMDDFVNRLSYDNNNLILQYECDHQMINGNHEKTKVYK